jgi:hypothetical protein
MPDIDDTQLERLAKGIAYDVYQMQGCTRLLKDRAARGALRRIPGDDRLAVESALLESALIHLRALDEFLGRAEVRYKDDVRAVHFDPNWQPQGLLTHDQRQLIDKRLAHITIERGKEPEAWETDAFIRALATFNIFLSGLANRHPVRHRWFGMEPVRVEYLL